MKHAAAWAAFAFAFVLVATYLLGLAPFVALLLVVAFLALFSWLELR